MYPSHTCIIWVEAVYNVSKTAKQIMKKAQSVKKKPTEYNLSSSLKFNFLLLCIEIKLTL